MAEEVVAKLRPQALAGKPESVPPNRTCALTADHACRYSPSQAGVRPPALV